MIRAFLSFKTLTYMLAAYGVVMLSLSWLTGGPLEAGVIIQWARFIALGIAVLIVLVFGLSHRLAPWRMLWRRFPLLNDLVYPDINGVWIGTTKSNWPVIEAVRKAAISDEAADLSVIESLPLREDPIAFEIKAHWFGISIRTKTSAVGGKAFANDVEASRNIRNRDFEIEYLYEQHTPKPAGTDESQHPGAATLEIKTGDGLVLEGEYWTRRAWAQGMNTAGIILLKRVSDKHLRKTDDIFEAAKRMEAAE